VSDGVHVAQLTLLGRYAASDFSLAIDGVHRTTVTAPAIANPSPTTSLDGGSATPDIPTLVPLIFPLSCLSQTSLACRGENDAR